VARPRLVGLLAPAHGGVLRGLLSRKRRLTLDGILSGGRARVSPSRFSFGWLWNRVARRGRPCEVMVRGWRGRWMCPAQQHTRCGRAVCQGDVARVNSPPIREGLLAATQRPARPTEGGAAFRGLGRRGATAPSRLSRDAQRRPKLPRADWGGGGEGLGVLARGCAPTERWVAAARCTRSGEGGMMPSVGSIGVDLFCVIESGGS
jgi:hypothetical protein